MSSSSSTDDDPPKRPLTRVPIWLPVSAFIGTSLALGIPLLLLRRRQRSVLRLSLKDGSSPPPRRRMSTLSVPTFTSSPFSSTSSSPPPQEPDARINLFSSSDSDRTSVMSAMSHLTASSGMMAAKAFAIATGLVAASTLVGVWGVREYLGVTDTKQFGIKMRIFLSTSFPSLSTAIYRPPVFTPEERAELASSLSSASSGSDLSNANSTPPFSDTTESRLTTAYEQGGFSLWAQVALRELEHDARAEREKRTKEVEESSRA